MSLTKQSHVLPDETIEEMARRYLSYLDGVSLGDRATILAACGAAVVAIEIARELITRGMSVRLVLMDLPGARITKTLYGTGVLKSARLQDASVLSESATGTRRSGSLMARVYRHVRFRLKTSSVYRNYLLAKFDSVARTQVALSDNDALAYCNARLNKSLAGYQVLEIECPVKLVWSRQWSNSATNTSELSLNSTWERAFPELASMHLSPARIHNDLLKGESAKVVADLLEG